MGYVNNIDAINAYKKISQFPDKSAKYFKTLFHIHSPASYDYKLFVKRDNFNYDKATYKELYNICVEYKLFPQDKNSDYKIFPDIGVNDHTYDSYKEALTYLLFVYFMAEEKIDIAIITDHNTIKAYPKIDRALKNLKDIKIRPKNYCPTIIMGIEVSCADKNHVVGIFDYNNKDALKQLEEWLDYNLVNEQDGTVLTSKEVLEFFHNNINGFAYIAHLDNSDMIQKSGYLSGAYKNDLLDSEYCSFVGCSNPSKISFLKDKLKNYSKKDYKIIIDNDSHAVDEIDENHMWIKGSKRDLHMIKEALNNYDVSVSLNYDSKLSKRQYIKGMYIQHDAFLSNQEKNGGFIIRFSPFLNSIIGGRGTGKSTIIKFLEYTLNQKCGNLEFLNFICMHGHIWVLYIYQGTEYLIEMQNPTREKHFSNEADILQYFDFRPKQYYMYKVSDFHVYDIKDYAYKKNLHIYKVQHNSKDTFLTTVHEKKQFLNNFFDTTYSINELVNTANTTAINEFIFNTMFNNKVIRDPQNVNIKKLSGLKKLMQDTQNIMDSRKKQVEEIINSFNSAMKETLKIVYTQNQEVAPPDFKVWLNLNKPRYLNYYFQFNKQIYNIKNYKVIEYLEMIYDNYDIFGLFERALNKEKREESILDFIDNDIINNKNIGLNYKSVTVENEQEIIDLIYKRILVEQNVPLIKKYLKNYITEKEFFTIEFNVNSKTGSTGTNYKDIKVLSLGQKVVAMLDFILGYSEFSHDFRPLVIDQPEDNLDNQYIYYNLVKQLKDVKSKRQIILATHSSTIVTNTMSDLVCMMESDGKNGWIKKYGYLNEMTIKKEIINCLEGGIDSFKHKEEIYSQVLCTTDNNCHKK